MVIILAIFVAMFAFTSATIIALRVRQDLSTSKLGAERATQRLAVKGAVNHLLSMLRRGEGAQYVSGSPLKVTVGEVRDIAVWSEPDSGLSGVTHIRAERGGIESSKTVVDDPVRDSKIFFHADQKIYSRQPGDSSWSTLPAPPTVLYDVAGQAHTAQLHPLGNASVNDAEASQEGDLVVATSDVSGSDDHYAVHHWDDTSQVWLTLPPVPSFQFVGGTLQINPSYQPVSADGVSEGVVYSMTGGGLATYDLSQQQWSYFPYPALGERGRFATAGGGRFVTEMQDSVSQSRWLGVFEDGAWSRVDLADQEFSLRGVNTDGDILGAVFDPLTQDWTTQIYSGGSWHSPSLPAAIQGQELRAVDASGGLLFSGGATMATLWNEEDGSLSDFTLPSGTTLRPSNASEARQLAGGGKEVVGALPGLKVVSTY